MPQICSHCPQAFYSLLTLLASNGENNIFSRIHIDLGKVSFQNNHTTDCILFFVSFRRVLKYADSSITSFIIFFSFSLCTGIISACLNTCGNLSISMQQVMYKQISKNICIHVDNFCRNIFKYTISMYLHVSNVFLDFYFVRVYNKKLI